MAFPNSPLFVNATQNAATDPKVPGPVKLSREWVGVDVVERLRQCAASDPKHITQGPPPAKGPHVAILHQAFEKIAATAVPPLGVPSSTKEFDDAVRALQQNRIEAGERSGATYGPSTARAVLEYKKAHNIRRSPAAAVDNIVGILTIQSLDSDLIRASGGNPGPTPTTPGDPAALPLDIFVLFRLQPGATPGTRDKASEAQFNKDTNSAAYLKTHQKAVPVCFFGGRKNDGNTDKSQEAANEVIELRKKTKAGVTVILGVSIGGFPALNTALILSQQKINLSYVAINDGGWNDIEGDIISFDPLKIRIPGGIVADRKENFFQTFGHGLLKDSRGRGGFMQGTEFHGAIATGFTDVPVPVNSTVAKFTAFVAVRNQLPTPLNLVPLTLRERQPFAAMAHDEAVAGGFPRIDAVIKSLIKP